MYQHYKKKPLVCPMNHDCSIVTQSKWGWTFGIRNELLGFIYYVGLLLAHVAIMNKVIMVAPTPFLYLMIATIMGVIFSLYFVYLQLFVIRDYCFYCVISALVNLLLLINAIALYVAAAAVCVPCTS